MKNKYKLSQSESLVGKASTSLDYGIPENNPNAGGKAKEADREVIIVKGKAGIAGTVLLFAQYLQEDKLFRKVDIANINNLKEAGTYEFEIRITP